MILENKQLYKSYLREFSYPNETNYKNAVYNFFSEEASINVVHPINKIQGSQGYIDKVLKPMMKAFEGLYRSDYIVIGGNYEGNDWITSTGYFAGKMINDWLGMRANNRLVYIRFGEFHRMQNNKCVESYIFYDLPELMMELGIWPLSPSPGYSGHIPGPKTHDGLVYGESDPIESSKTLTIVEKMLSKLNTPNKEWYPYWHENMLWYGPAGFGSYIGIKNFENFQVPFESCFQGWTVELSDNNTIIKDFIRVADGNYATNGGWLSVNGKHVKRFLDQEPTNKDVSMRVCDWWRREENLLVENWVFVDVPDLLLQIDYDLFAKLK